MNQDYIDFIDKFYPKIKNQYRLYKLTPDELINKTVVAIRSGFSCGNEGGTEMIITEFDGRMYTAKPTKNSLNLTANGWGIMADELIFSVKLKE